MLVSDLLNEYPLLMKEDEVTADVIHKEYAFIILYWYKLLILVCESTSTILKELKDGIVVVKVYLKQ